MCHGEAAKPFAVAIQNPAAKSLDCHGKALRCLAMTPVENNQLG